MAMILMESFDDGLAYVRWNGDPHVGSYGRNGTLGSQIGDAINRSCNKSLTTHPNATTIIVGLAIRVTSWYGSDGTLGWLLPGATLRMGPTSSQVEIGHAAATVTTTVDSIPYGTWGHLGIEIKYHATTGYIKLYVNGVLNAEATGLNTGSLTAAGHVWTMTLGSTASNGVDYWHADDLYVLDDTGPAYAANSFIGDAIIEVIRPSGNGNSSGMLGSDGNSTDNYLLVDDTGTATTEYVGSEIEGVKDTYAMGNLPSSGVDVHGVAVNHYAEKTDGGVKYMRSLVRTSSVDYPSSSLLLAQNPELYVNHFDYNPGTLAEWTAAQIDLAEFGQEVRDS